MIVKLLKNIPIWLVAMTVLMISFLPVMAQDMNTSPASITVMTDKSSYDDGEKLTISGTVKDQLNVPISIVIKDPNQKIVLIGQVSPEVDNTYSTEVTAGGSLWAIVGQYEIDVTYGSKDRVAKTDFQFTGSQPYPITIEGSSYNSPYKITNGQLLAITPNTASKSLLVTISPSGSGILVITLPRVLIDSKTGNQDTQFAIQEDGTLVSAQENKTDSSRTLSIAFSSTTKQIVITGTQIVPEFGPVSFIILSIAMAFVLFYVKIRHFRLVR